MIPKVFVSHASEDKKRFVENFATKLRGKGIDAWLDKWEMLPGDSLVDKIFEEGIKNAQAIIVVISKNSIKKPWVREELNSSMVKKINTGSKLIPVIIDDCEVPECLQSTVWQSIKDINKYDEELDKIVMSIFGQNNKPPIGKPPTYVNTVIDQFQGLTKVDSIIFKAACDNAIKRNSIYMIDSSSVFNEVSKYGINQNNFHETLDILDGRGHIKATKGIDGSIPLFNITIYGLSEYINLYVKDFSDIMKKVCFYIVNNNLSNLDIAKELNESTVLIDHVFDLLKQKGLIDFQKTLAGEIFLFRISPELKRMLE